MSGCVLISATTNPGVKVADCVRTAPMAHSRAGRTRSQLTHRAILHQALWPDRDLVARKARDRRTRPAPPDLEYARAGRPGLVYPDLFHFQLQHRRQ